ncbi:MAG TPA: hypothetical protein VK922_03360 [Gemmatimonadaceae bacterium]|nr:hypothetical protein [Gemmatimonadaceae bacterium]
MPDERSDAPPVRIRLRRHRDGRVTLTCSRADGSVTWQRQQGASARFFPFHDLTHFAVETVLANRRGFYRLIADGWDIGDFGAPWPRGRLPPEAAETELLVGLFDMERASGAEWTARDFEEQAERHGESREHAGNGAVLTDSQLVAIRRSMRDLFARWNAVPPDGTLELEFAPPSGRS